MNLVHFANLRKHCTDICKLAGTHTDSHLHYIDPARDKQRDEKIDKQISKQMDKQMDTEMIN